MYSSTKEDLNSRLFFPIRQVTEHKAQQYNNSNTVQSTARSQTRNSIKLKTKNKQTKTLKVSTTVKCCPHEVQEGRERCLLEIGEKANSTPFKNTVNQPFTVPPPSLQIIAEPQGGSLTQEFTFLAKI